MITLFHVSDNHCNNGNNFARSSRSIPTGFTLIELSIVLVIISLIIGGILTGRDLITTAAARAQITQIEKYNSAVNAFQNKFGGLPGDLPNPQASQFGFISRGAWAGAGDGDGYIESYFTSTACAGYLSRTGETLAFWVDLSTANLIEGGFNTGAETSNISGTITSYSSPSLNAYFPQAKISNNNYVTVWSSGGCDAQSNVAVSGNFFTVSQVTSLSVNSRSDLAASTGITTAQANYIDTKMDDGYATSGNVLAFYWDNSTFSKKGTWGVANSVTTGSPTYMPATTATTGSTATCYDNNNVAGPMRYSTEISGGNLANCALSFKFQ